MSSNLTESASIKYLNSQEEQPNVGHLGVHAHGCLSAWEWRAQQRSERGRVLLRENTNVSATGGPTPATDWRPADLTPNLQAAMPAEMLAAARDSICGVFGVLPALFSPMGQGAMTREAQRHLATWCLQPIAELLAEEASEKLGGRY